MVEAKIGQIPNFIEASSKKRLRLLMLKNNVRLGGHVKYFDFQEQQSGRFVCWYYEEIDQYEIDKEQLKMGEVDDE